MNKQHPQIKKKGLYIQKNFVDKSFKTCSAGTLKVTPAKSCGIRIWMWALCHTLTNDFHEESEPEKNRKPKIVLPFFSENACELSNRDMIISLKITSHYLVIFLSK